MDIVIICPTFTLLSILCPQAFKILMSSQGDLYCLGKGKFYREDGDLTLDVGPFAAALEFATDRKAIVVGKPGQ